MQTAGERLHFREKTAEVLIRGDASEDVDEGVDREQVRVFELFAGDAEEIADQFQDVFLVGVQAADEYRENLAGLTVFGFCEGGDAATEDAADAEYVAEAEAPEGVFVAGDGEDGGFDEDGIDVRLVGCGGRHAASVHARGAFWTVFVMLGGFVLRWLV